MARTNVEIKAKISKPEEIRRFLRDRGAVFRGTDHQRDTYFRVPRGRLKIREGTIESCIVHYTRADETGPKRCDYEIERFEPGSGALSHIRKILARSLGVLAVVDKEREIYFIDNVKFHIDTVRGLGTFFEIEAVDTGGSGERKLHEQCAEYLERLGITEEQLVSSSYSDMVLESPEE